MIFKRWLLTVLFLSSLLLTVGVPKTEGHGYIVRSIPADRSVVTRAPNTVQIWFSEGLEPRFSTIEVFNQRGEKVDLRDGGTDDQNTAKLVVSLPPDLPQGAYLVRMRPVFTSDGHAVNDTLVFWVGEQVGSFDEAGTQGTAVPLEVVWRILLTLALTVLFGTFLMYPMVLRPAWGNAQWTLGNLPPRVMLRLSGLVWLSLWVALVVNGLALLQITMSLVETDLAGVFAGDSLNIVLQGTNFGDVWQIRMVLLVAMLGIQVMAAQQAKNRPGSTHILWLVNGVLALLALGTLSLISHASGSPIWPALSVVMDFVHLSAVAAWIGGLITLALVLRPALHPLSPEQRGKAILALLKRYSPMAVICVSLIVTTGLYASTVNLYAPSDMADSTYGLTLLAKLMLILPLLALGGIHFIAGSPEKMAKIAAWLQPHERFRQFPQTLRVEMIFALVVMVAAATLPATPPPSPDSARGEVELAAKTMTVEGYEVQLTVSPGAVGANSYDVSILKNGTAAEVDSIKIRFSQPERGVYTAPLALDFSEAGLWVGASGDITRAADWDVLIDINEGNAAPVRALLKWKITDEVQDAKTRAAGIFHWLTALLVAGVVCLWIIPPIYAFVQSLDWTKEILAITAASVIFLVIITVGGAFFFAETSRRVEEQRNPLPEVTNPIPANQESVSRGHLVYQVECAACHGNKGSSRPYIAPIYRAGQPLREALAEESDEDMFRLLVRGRVGRHLYGTELTDAERWHVINFVRQLE